MSERYADRGDYDSFVLLVDDDENPGANDAELDDFAEEFELDDDTLHDRYDEMLDEVYGTVSVAGYEHYTSDLLKEIDEAAYRCGFNDWLDSEVSNGNLIEF